MGRPSKEQKAQSENVDQTLGQQEGNNQEVMIPLSEVEKLIEKKLAEKESSQPKQQEQPVVKIVEKFVEKKESSDDIPGLEDFEYKDRLYVSITYPKAVSQNIRDRHKKGSPLQWTNPITKTVHSLRYASNQTSFLADKQTGDVLISHISLKNGKLLVPKENVTLQKFLAIHPENGVTFKELDKELESKKALEEEELEFEARKLAKELSFVKQSAIARLICQSYTDDWKAPEIKLAIYQKAKENPRAFLKVAKDPTLEKKGIVALAKYRGYIAYRNKSWYNADGQVIVQVEPTQDENDALVNYLSTNNGSALYEYLKASVAE